jgi:alkylhydroperoxidase/carboxymuconolactone decarboxylase family protein YurZ
MADAKVIESGRGKRLPGLMQLLEDIDPSWTQMFKAYVTEGIYKRGVLTPKQFELCSIISLAVLDQQRELKNHMQECFAAGASRQEIAEVIFLASCHAGFPKTMSALRTYHELLSEMEAEQPGSTRWNDPDD